MSRFRSVVLLTFAFFAAAPLSAQGRQERVRTTDQVWDRHSREDSDEDSEDSDEDSEDSDRRERGSRDRSDRRGRDTCVDVDRDGRCDYRSRHPSRSDSDVCVDRNRDGQCDARATDPRRRIPRVLQAIIFGQ